MSSKITPFDSPTAAFDGLEVFKSVKVRPSDLHLFKQLLEKSKTGLHFYPYTLKKRQILIYKALFFAIGCLLSLLGLYIYMTSFNFIAMHFFALGYFAKTLIISFTTVLSTLAFVTAAKMQPHKEMILDHVNKAKKKARRQYRKKIFFLKYQRTVENAEIDDAKTSWNFLFEDIVETLEEKKESALLLAERIHLSKILMPIEKEKLFNEMLVELRETLKGALQEFAKGRV